MNGDGCEDGLSDLETAIERRLQNWAPDGTGSADVTKRVPASQTKSKSKRRKRQRAAESERKECSEPRSLIDPAISEAQARHRQDAARSALSRALVAPRASRSSAAVATATAATARLNPPERRVVVDAGASPAELLGLRSAGAWGDSAGEGAVLAGEAGVPGSSSAFAFVEKHRREVGDLGAAALAKKDKKKFDARRRLEAGLKPLKSQKLPLPMLLGMRKKQRHRDIQEKDLALATGMLIRSKRKNK